nr:hypothetical protein [uncultured Flavobacterium sp.]
MKKITKSLLPSFVIFLSIFFISGCSRNENSEEITNASLPKLSTSDVTSILPTSAISGGIIENDGGSQIISQGICWSSTNSVPTIADENKTVDVKSANFSSSITGLVPNKTYYLRAFAVNKAGVAYGNTLSFKTTNILSDKLFPVTTTSVKVVGRTTVLVTVQVIDQGRTPVKSINAAIFNSLNREVGKISSISEWNLNNPFNPVTFQITEVPVTSNYKAVGYATNSYGTGKSENLFATFSISK